MHASERMELPALTYNLDMEYWLISAQFRQLSMTGAIAPERFTCTEEGTPSTPENKFVIHADLSGLGVQMMSPVTIDLVFRSWIDLSGMQTGPCTFIAMRFREQEHSGADLVNSTLNTMMHEPAHSMGLAVPTLPDGNNNPNYYLIPGGPHCNALSNRCMMYEANTGSTTFCPHCIDSIRGRNLDSMPINETNPY